MAIQNVVLVGAGGTVGPFILTALDKAGFNVTILSRQSSSSNFGDHKVIKVGDDYPHDELVAAFKGQHAVISTISVTGSGKLNTSVQESLIDAAIEAGVQRFIPSEFGGDTRNAAGVELSPIYRGKLNVVEYLQSKKGKIEYTIVPTGPFLEFGIQIGFLGNDLKQDKFTITEGGDNKFTATTLPQVGEGVAAILKHDKETANQYVPLESFLITQNELHAALETGGRKLKIEHQSGKALIENSQAGVSSGSIWALYGLIQATVFIPGYGSEFADTKKWREVLGLSKLGLQTEVKRVLAEL